MPVATEGELKPPFLVKLLYAFGQAIESGYLVVAGFVFFYYTAVLGLSGSMVGVALAISMCLDAVMDPLIGSFSDNLRSKFGRRLPLMVLGAPLTGLALWMLFSPPLGLQPLILFTWLVAFKMALRGVASLYNLPYAALGAEMASGYAERASVVAYRGAFGVVISLAVTILAYSVFFAGPGGLQERSYYPAFGAGMGALLFGAGAICCLGVWRYARRLPQPTTPGATLMGGLAREVPEVFRNASFRSLFLSALLFWIAAGVNGALNNHAYTFVWKLPPQMIQSVNASFYVAIMIGVPITRPLLNRFEKKTVIMLGLALLAGALTVMHGLRAMGLFMLTGAAVVPWLMANVAVAGVGIGFLVVAYPAMMADAADEHEMLFGARREGLYFAGLGFAAKAAGGFGQMAAGFALDALHFPKAAGHVVGAVVPEHTLRLLILAWGPLAALFAVGSALALLPYGVSRVRHAELAAALKLKRAEDISAGRSS
ncbi:MAG: MFS transporter [Alphaproteobacteria bacterium]|nr:MFS transporter [Alphaproteobacteria bacterium]MBU1515103.1 MFS transporter [Alphaproteobacteria bacterium]MBU2093461.1 MFS transporter [Alphaproteobacteria bacterium]MBU2152309.1 MFS transporter [Alphaproteobacteria bacterium]MBU2308123.1 MFS transporter [Alphaproteobacteria bacterium]